MISKTNKVGVPEDWLLNGPFGHDIILEGNAYMYKSALESVEELINLGWHKRNGSSPSKTWSLISSRFEQLGISGKWMFYLPKGSCH